MKKSEIFAVLFGMLLLGFALGRGCTPEGTAQAHSLSGSPDAAHIAEHLDDINVTLKRIERNMK